MKVGKINKEFVTVVIMSTFECNGHKSDWIELFIVP